jgi:hypothetical protein
MQASLQVVDQVSQQVHAVEAPGAPPEPSSMAMQLRAVISWPSPSVPCRRRYATPPAPPPGGALWPPLDGRTVFIPIASQKRAIRTSVVRSGCRRHPLRAGPRRPGKAPSSETRRVDRTRTRGRASRVVLATEISRDY